MADPVFLLDSNICIYILEGLSAQARRQVEARRPGEVVTSAVAYAEVMRGVDAEDPVAVAKVEALFDIVEVLPFDRMAAEVYRAVPFKRGTFDRLIGAHALALDLTLVTNNVRDYSGIAGLRVENWTRP